MARTVFAAVASVETASVDVAQRRNRRAMPQQSFVLYRFAVILDHCFPLRRVHFPQTVILDPFDLVTDISHYGPRHKI